MRVAEVAVVRAVDADEIDAQVRHVVSQPLAHDLAGEAGTLYRPGARVGDLAFADKTGAVAHAHFVR